MTLKEKWDHFRETLTHHKGMEGKHAPSEQKEKDEQWDRALHQSDQSSGSETLDD